MTGGIRRPAGSGRSTRKGRPRRGPDTSCAGSGRNDHLSRYRGEGRQMRQSAARQPRGPDRLRHRSRRGGAEIRSRGRAVSARRRSRRRAARRTAQRRQDRRDHPGREDPGPGRRRHSHDGQRPVVDRPRRGAHRPGHRRGQGPHLRAQRLRTVPGPGGGLDRRAGRLCRDRGLA